MTLRSNSILFFFLLVAFTKINAQEPTHFILGEEELAGIDIYDLLQDQHNNYWLATDQGLIKYDGYSFKNINSDKSLSSSIFDLQLDYNNKLFCKNLSGQIFHIKNDSCLLYFQLPDSLMHPEFHFAFDNNNDLIVSTNSLFKITKTKKIEFIGKHIKTVYYKGFTTLKDSSLFCTSSINQFNITWKNNTLKIEKFKMEQNNLFIFNFQLNDKLYHYDASSGKLLVKKQNNYSIAQSSPLNLTKDKELKYCYPTNKNLFVAKQKGGATVYDENLQPLFNHKVIFKNKFISTVYEDHEGNFLLGTFGEGIITLTNLELKNIKLPDINAKANCITSNKDFLYIGLQDGRIYSIDSTNNYSMLWNIQSKKVETLEYIKETNGLLVDGMRNKIINLNTGKKHLIGFSSIKDVNKIAPNMYLISSNYGLDILEVYENNNLGHLDIKTTPILNLKPIRTNCANFDSLTNTYYAGTSLGLKIGNKNNSSYFKLNNSSLICRDIINHDNKIYIATQNNGILIFKNKKLTAHWTSKNGLVSNQIKQLKIYQNQLFLTTKIGLQIIDLEKNNHCLFNKTNGLLENNILDFEIKDEAIWFVFQKGIQTIQLKELNPPSYIPQIKINTIHINDSAIYLNDGNSFPYNKNKVEFHLSSTSIKYKNELKYYHKIEEIDEYWQYHSYENNKILYKTLPPGNYTFKIKAVYRTHESETLTYHFTITPPFYLSFCYFSYAGVLYPFKTSKKEGRIKK